jgi:uncharacterized protein (TIGR02172 family)
MNEINLNDYIQVGEGGNGRTYRKADNPDILLKVNNAPNNDEASVKRELQVSQHVFALGLPTPRMYEMVRVGDGYGQLVECIRGKKSLQRIMADDLSRINEAADLLATEGRMLHATPCDTSFFTNRKALAAKAVETVEYMKDYRERLLAFVEGIDDVTTCVHGDFHGGNLIVSGDQKPYWIDLGWFCYGSPMFDIAHLFLICEVYSQFPQTQDIFHMNHEQMKLFWDAFATAYTGSADHADFDVLAGRFAPFDLAIRSILMPTPAAYNALFANVVRGMVEKYY